MTPPSSPPPAADRAGRGPKLEVHEHCIISGPNANKTWLNRITHSHEGGDQPHGHDDGTHRTGPGAYTIDKDEWLARTGLKGGGRKKFTSKPTGPQMPLVPREPSQIKVVIVGDGGAAAARGCTGPGVATVDRIVLACKAKVVSVEHVPSGSGSGKRRAV